MILENGTAIGMRRPRPHTVDALNFLRSQLLQDPFFDEEHKPEELGMRMRTRPARPLFMDVVVLMARLMRVLMQRAPLSEDELAERIKVRNDCLDQAFFDRTREQPRRPFVYDSEDDDEGCCV